MNANRAFFTSLTLILWASAAQADGAKRTTPKPARESRVVVTGSLIPERSAERHQNTTRATGPVVVLTSADIQRIGARDLADALRRGTALAH